MVKVAVVGQVRGEFRAVITKLNALQQKQSFAFVLFTGNVFGAETDDNDNTKDLDDLLAGRISVSVPIYFSLGDAPIPARVQAHVTENGGEVCPNLFFLGRKGSIKTAEGVQIVALGGTVNGARTDDQVDKFAATYSLSDVLSLGRDVGVVDIVLSSDWPAQITTGSKRWESAASSASSVKESPQMAQLCARLRPRYHFSSSPNIFFEREPFLHPLDETKQISSAASPALQTTRFISLASFSNTGKQKWIYAFNLDPAPSSLTVPVPTLPPDITPSPLEVPHSHHRKRMGTDGGQDGPDSGAFSRFDTNRSSFDRRGPKRRRGQAPPPPTPAECFFCLANPNIASHLIASIGNEAYVTTAKGPLPTSFTFPSLRGTFPGHMLIIPLAHTPTLSIMEDEESRKSTKGEMSLFRAAIHNMVSTISRGELGTVTWEVSRPTGVHVHWQMMPLPAQLIENGLVEAAFKVEAENRKYPSFLSSPDTDADGTKGGEDSDNCVNGAPDSVPSFFRVRIWKPIKRGSESSAEVDQAGGHLERQETTLTLNLEPGAYFDLQFGRHVLAQLLGLDSRKQWKDCVQTEEEETAETERWKEAFAPFDFTT